MSIDAFVSTHSFIPYSIMRIWSMSSHLNRLRPSMAFSRLSVFLTVTTGVATGCAAWSAWSSSQAAHATLELAQLERRDRIEASDTAEYQKLEKVLSDGVRLQMDAAFRTRFDAIISQQASLSANALAVYRAGVAHRPDVLPRERDDIRSHLVDWYFGPVHQMTQLNFRNKGPEAAFGSGLIHAPTYLYLIMWRLGTCAESSKDLQGYLARYNRDVRMARGCGTEHIKATAEKQMLGPEEAAELFSQVQL